MIPQESSHCQFAHCQALAINNEEVQTVTALEDAEVILVDAA
jgi:hypothetical protein